LQEKLSAFSFSQKAYLPGPMIRVLVEMARAAGIAVLVAVVFAPGPLAAQAPHGPQPRAFDPSEVYFQGWLQLHDAEELEKDGDFVGALEKLERARALLQSIVRVHPEWKVTMVSGRVASTDEALARVRPKAEAQRKPEAEALAELEGPMRRDPKGSAKGVRVRPAAGSPRRIVDLNSVSPAELGRAIGNLRRQLDTARADPASDPRERRALATRLREAEEVQAKINARPVRAEVDRLNARIAELERARAATARALDLSRGDQEAAKKQIEAVRAELARVRQQAADLDRNIKIERRTANDVIRGQQEQLRRLRKTIEGKDKELAAARRQIGNLEQTLNETRDAFTELRDERDSLLRERDHMAALLKLNEAGRIQELIDQNMALAKELRHAKERFKRINDDNNATKDELTEALRDLAIAKSRIINLQKANGAQQKRLASLEEKLRRADKDLASGGGNAEEVSMLRDIIRRQLRIQERRRQARELLLAQVKRLGLADKGMDDAMALLDNAELRLTPAEQKLINTHQADVEFISPFAATAAQRGQAMGRVEQERRGLDNAGSRAFATGRLAASEELFRMILDAHPGHVPTLLKLGVVELKRADPSAAAEAFRDAVAMDGENAYARRMLGVAFYKAEEYKDAEEELRHALAINPEDAMGHVYLGNVTVRLGRKKEAEKHFKAAIDIDPTLDEPYFNLAALCAADGRKKEGKDYYKMATDNGGLPDPRLEELLGL
jgi:tetratricopeptide (TPR) repeat protein